MEHSRPRMDLLSTEPPQRARFEHDIGAWVLTRYADVDAALRNPAFSAAADGDWHSAYRHAAGEAFSGQKLESWRLAIEQEAWRICTVVRSRPCIDLVRDFA